MKKNKIIKWQYWIETVGIDVLHMNELGRAGWELVSIDERGVAYFKRLAQE